MFKPPATSLPALLTLAVACWLPLSVRAADHGDAPAVSQDAGADIADEYVFLDPTDNSRVVIIGTVHGFIVPGEAPNFAVFDPNVKFRFEAFNKHVNKPAPATPQTAFLNSVYPNRFIDVSFSKSVATPTANDPKPNLVKPGPQSATLAFNGFPGITGTKTITKTSSGAAILTTPSTVKSSPNPRVISTISVDGDAAHDIKFFAGETDDPFFFDLVGFSRLVASIHDGATDTSTLSRARDTFAGYNVLAIAFSIPKVLLTDPSGPIVGFDFQTLRHATEMAGTDGVVGTGAFRRVDRVGNPAVNVALLPFNKKNLYNASYPRLDVAGKFAPDIVATIAQLGLNTSQQNIALLASIAIAHGDLLQLNTSIANTGSNSQAAFPNGRRLTDDVIDTILSVLANGPIGDGVNANDLPFLASFPFLALPQQPRATGVLDDNTRN